MQALRGVCRVSGRRCVRSHGHGPEAGLRLRGREAEGGFPSGCRSGYWRLHKRLGAKFWRSQNGGWGLMGWNWLSPLKGIPLRCG